MGCSSAYALSRTLGCQLNIYWDGFNNLFSPPEGYKISPEDVFLKTKRPSALNCSNIKNKDSIKSIKNQDLKDLNIECGTLYNPLSIPEIEFNKLRKDFYEGLIAKDLIQDKFSNFNNSVFSHSKILGIQCRLGDHIKKRPELKNETPFFKKIKSEFEHGGYDMIFTTSTSPHFNQKVKEMLPNALVLKLDRTFRHIEAGGLWRRSNLSGMQSEDIVEFLLLSRCSNIITNSTWSSFWQEACFISDNDINAFGLMK
tara:strand:+ start:3006 stop:3773 length:768 start_codon:yes stop_codon:yes gene_type:complete